MPQLSVLQMDRCRDAFVLSPEHDGAFIDFMEKNYYLCELCQRYFDSADDMGDGTFCKGCDAIEDEKQCHTT